MREHDKLLLVRDKSQAIGEFIEWLRHEKLIVLARWEKETYIGTDGKDRTRAQESLRSVYLDIERTLAEFFSIDLEKLEEEKRRG